MLVRTGPVRRRRGRRTQSHGVVVVLQLLLLLLLLLLHRSRSGGLHLMSHPIVGRRQRSHGRAAKVLWPVIAAEILPAAAGKRLQLRRCVIRGGHVPAVPVITASVGLPRPLVTGTAALAVVLLLLEEVVGRRVAVILATAVVLLYRRRHRTLLLLLRATADHDLLLLHGGPLLDVVGELGRRHPAENEKPMSVRPQSRGISEKRFFLH